MNTHPIRSIQEQMKQNIVDFSTIIKMSCMNKQMDEIISKLNFQCKNS